MPMVSSACSHLKDPLSKKGYFSSGDRRWSDTHQEYKPRTSLEDEQCKQAISLMTHTNDQETIFQKMRETFEYRQRLIHKTETSATVLSVFPRLLDTKGLILQDFSLLFGPETSASLLERWPSYKPKLIKEASMLASTSYLEQLLQSAREEQGESCEDILKSWDSDMSTLLLLLHILSPQPAGRKRTTKISALKPWITS